VRPALSPQLDLLFSFRQSELILCRRRDLCL
jgi:hypothetical protein